MKCKKQKFSIFSNFGYAVRFVWKYSKLYLVFTVMMSMIDLLSNLVQLYIAPVILQKVEQAVALEELLLTICIFVMLLLSCNGLKAYLLKTGEAGYRRLEHGMTLMRIQKSCTTSYSNLSDTKYKEAETAGLHATYAGTGNSIYGILPHFMKLLTAVAGFILYLLLLRKLPTLLFLVVILTTILGFFISKRSNEWGFIHREESAQIKNRKTYLINLAMANEMPKDIRIFGMQEWLDDVWNSTMTLWKAFCERQEKHLMAAKAVDVLLSFARNGIAYFYLITMVLRENLSASEFLLYFSAVTGFTTWITTILNSVSDIHKCSLRVCEIREYMEWPEPFRFEEGKPVSPKDFTDYEFQFEDVTYRYPGGEQDIISHMNLTISPGEKIAVVGLNGAGKTTFIKLLCGLLDPTEGRVLLNGQDIREFNRRDYYGLFTAVFQEFSRLQASIAENIAQSMNGIDHLKLMECVEKAGLSETIEKLPAGADTLLGKIMNDEGVELSGGQFQRLMLARALYKDAPILLLDEPTAALDPIAENDIYHKYNEMTNGKVSVFISHRLASTRFCDRIIFLENGKIAEEGTHEELIISGGRYCELFEVQSQYYREGGMSHEQE